MFSPQQFQKYMKVKSSRLPEVTVSKEEFVRRMVASGCTQQTAEFQAGMSEALGSSVNIGNEMVRIG